MALVSTDLILISFQPCHISCNLLSRVLCRPKASSRIFFPLIAFHPDSLTSLLIAKLTSGLFMEIIEQWTVFNHQFNLSVTYFFSFYLPKLPAFSLNN